MSRRSRQVPTAPKPPEEPTTLRGDGWENIATGMGISGRDKRLGSTFFAQALSQATCEQIWKGDDIAARCVETIPNEMLREEFCIRVAEDAETSEEIDEEHRELKTVEALRTCCYYARALGGGGIFLGVDDGQKDLSKPLKEEQIRALNFLAVYSPQELMALTYYSDPLRERYGDIETYRLVPLNTPPGAVATMPIIHESRIVRIDGVITTRMALLANVQPGWPDSIFVRMVQVINDFQAAWQGASILMTDFATPTLKIKGLAKALASQGANDVSIAQRARMLELCRSIARVSIVDADGEEYKRETTSIQGMAEMLDKIALRVAAAASMPISLLMGQAPAGLNATGDSDIRWFYDQVKSLQKRLLKPAIKRITEIMLLAKDGPSAGKPVDNWNVEFPELWQLTELEQVTAHKTQADADAVYITAQVVTPEEVAKSRFGGDEYSTRTVIDMELRDTMMVEGDHQQERLDPEPVVDPNVAAKLAGGTPPAPGAGAPGVSK